MCVRADISRLNSDTVISSLVERTKQSPQATRFIFCVPDEWYRRSSTTSRITAVSMSPSDSTLKRLSELEAEDADGTAKAKHSPQASAPASPTTKRASDGSGGTFSSRRFSSIFDGWLGGSGSSSPLAPASPRIGEPDNGEDKDSERKPTRPVVSEPVALEKHTASASDIENEADLDEEDFEQMIVSPARPYEK